MAASVAIHDSHTQLPSPSPLPATIFRSRLPDIPIPHHLPLHTYCFQKLNTSPDAPCIISTPTGHTLSFSEFHLLCRRTAAGLAALGIKHGDCIMILLQNCTEFAVTFMAASMLGAVTTTANPFCTPSEILKQFASSTKLVVTQSQYIDKLRADGFPPVTVVTIDGVIENCVSFADVSAADENSVPIVAINTEEDAVALPFSSGTTGLPKGMMLTHKGLVSGVAQLVDGENPNMHLGEGDVVLCVMPLFHMFSLSVLLCSLRAGAAVAIMPKFEMNMMLEVIEKYKVTMAALVPPLVLALAENPVVDKYDLGSVRKVMSGAAPLGKDLQEALSRRVPLAVFGQGYGMTEAGPVSMSPAFAKIPSSSKSGSCGTIVRNTELKVVDTETGFSFGHNQPGEICIRGPQIMKGYLNDQNATSTIIDVEGWIHTGDIGLVDDDGEVFIVDRVKELIKFKGFQVPPAELEALLVSHPFIVDAAVIPKMDDDAGEVPVAFIVRSKNSDITEQAIKEFISKQVVFYKRLHSVYFIHSIPKSVSGKILRKDLKARLVSS